MVDQPDAAGGEQHEVGTLSDQELAQIGCRKEWFDEPGTPQDGRWLYYTEQGDELDPDDLVTLPGGGTAGSDGNNDRGSRQRRIA
jgi:hypothetical protein